MSRVKILGLIRHVLTFGGGFLVAKGLVDEGTLNEMIAGVMTLTGLIWSMMAPEKRES